VLDATFITKEFLMSIITQISQQMRRLLSDRADELGHSSGFIRRQRRGKITGSNFCQTLIFGWWENPAASLEQLCQMGLEVGLAISPQGISQRFNEAAGKLLRGLLQEIAGEAVTGCCSTIPLLRRFNGVYLEDSTVVSLPAALADQWLGCGNGSGKRLAAVKLQVRWEMQRGQLDGPHLVAGRVHDREATTAHACLPAGSLHLADLGYWKLGRLAKWHQQGVFWLSRPQAQTTFWDEGEQHWSLAAFVHRQAADRFDVTVQLGCQHRLPARLVGVRVPTEVAAQRRRKLHEAGRRKGQTISADRLTLCDWTLFVTNVPTDRLAFDDILVLARLRWQIELLFKLWKSHGLLDQSRSQNPWWCLCEFYAKLIALVLQHWTLLASVWLLPDRSLVKAALAIRRYVLSLVIAFHTSLLAFQTALHHLLTIVTRRSRINKSVKSPRMFQLLLAVPELCS
jgi:hypothetical protein